jgi:cell division transport system permease protein
MARRRSAGAGAADPLGLRRLRGDRGLPVLVAAMAFLAALALAGSSGAAALAQHWREDQATAATVTLPAADTPVPAMPSQGTPAQATPAQSTPPLATASVGAADAALALLRGTQGVAHAQALPAAEVAALVRPWLGDAAGNPSMPLPTVIALRLGDPKLDLAALQTRLREVAPGAQVEGHAAWVARIAALAHAIQLCAWAALALVAAVAVAVVAVATRAGLAARREAIEILHGLGATDAFVAARFAGRTTRLTGLGGLAGAVAALPVLLALEALASPVADTSGHGPAPDLAALLRAAPAELMAGLPLLPLVAALIGLVTAQWTVRRWLRRLP